tara:strand:+ start:202 stop:435 length:234 start_codon:yes stop_codon:yes gene_type:complete
MEILEYILLALSLVSLLFYFFKGQNVVWGGATLGLIIGVLVGLFTDYSFFTTIKWGFIIGTLVGVIYELLFKLIQPK